MLLVQQEKLHFKDEKSDKVYEVYLFHIQEDEYVVNFKYGRRGKKLNEGTKTVFPVSKDQADKVFAELVISKTKKGYHIVSDYGDSPTEIIAKITHGELEENPARPVVLSYLKRRAQGEVLTTNWKLSRIIWRAGELRIDDAVPYIASILPQLIKFDLYSAIWTLGRIANPASFNALQALNVSEGQRHNNIYIGALLNCKDNSTIDKVIASLPSQLGVLYKAGNYDAFANILYDYLGLTKGQDASFLLDVYYLSLNNKKLKNIFIPILREVQLIPGNWKYIRYIFKVAEMVEDGETFGTIARSVNLQNAFYTKPRWGSTIYLNRERLDLKNEIGSPNSRVAFSNKTKDFFVNRVLRTLRKAGYDRQESYCKFATGILTAYYTEDQQKERTSTSRNWDPETKRYIKETKTTYFMSHVPYFYYLLFSRGERFKIDRIKNFTYTGEASQWIKREDNFPMIWDHYPSYVVDVLVGCRHRVPMQFALLFLKERSDVDQLLSLETLIKMVDHPFPEVLEFSLEYIEKKYDSNNPNFELVQRLVNTGNPKAAELAIKLIDKNNASFITNVPFVKEALISEHEVIHHWLRTNIKANNFSDSEQQSILDFCFDHYLAFEGENFNTHSTDSLLEIFKEQLSETEPDRILEMLDHPKKQIKLLGAKLININKRKADEWPEKVILGLLSSEFSEIREEGMKLFASLSDEQLMQKDSLIGNLACNEHQDLRLRAREIIGRLAPSNSEFGKSIFLKLYNALLEVKRKVESDDIDEAEDERPTDIYTTIEMHLLDQTMHLEDDLENLLSNNNREVHLLASHYINNHADLNNWPVRSIAKMGGHDMIALRVKSHTFYNEQVDKIKFNKFDAIKIFDTDWEDTRDFASEYFETNFGEKEWDPELVITLCDSIRPKTQEYGTQILSKYFKNENGVRYLTSLSEHPDPTIQLYTTNYLDRFAFNNKVILDKLKPYFLTILGSINSNRVAKLRAIHFLEKQAKEGKDQARYVAEIFNELIGTMAVRENEKYVEVLRSIELAHEDINTDIEIVPLEIRY